MIVVLLLTFVLVALGVAASIVRSRRTDKAERDFVIPTGFVRLGIERSEDASSLPAIRVILVAGGVDDNGHAAKFERALREAGTEVIDTGLDPTPEQIVATAIKEDADAVGLSVSSGAHLTLVPRVVGLMREEGAEDVPVIATGEIPDADVPALQALGVAEAFTLSTPPDDIVEFMRTQVAQGPWVGRRIPR